ncbi:MAG: hypothetical protein HXY40_10770 [Chloroflexi bacterium]|nr:hypothetical protein [Chloroflexota bacterium]
MRFFVGGKTYLVVGAAYTLAALLTLNLLIIHLNTAVPNGFSSDFYQFHWNVWWLRYALAQGVSPLWSDYVLYPHVNNLSIHWLTPFWLPLYALLEPLLGRVGAINVMLLLSFPLTGLATFVWLRRLGVGSVIAFVGGLAYAFSPYMLDHMAKTHLNLTTLFWFPLTLLLWDEIALPRRWPRRFSVPLLTLLLWAVALTDMQYALWLPFTLGAYGLWTLWALWRRQNARAALAAAACGLAALLLLLPLLWLYPLAALAQVDRSNATEFPPAGLNTVRSYALPPAALLGLAPMDEDRSLGRVLPALLWGALLLFVMRRRTNAAPTEKTEDAAPGPPLGFWLLLALPPLLLAFGPDIMIGDFRLALPYLPLHEALGGQYRNPTRFAMPALLCLITFAALVWDAALAHRTQRKQPIGSALLPVSAGALSLLLLWDVGAFQPFPTRIMPDYAIHNTIAGDTRDFVILDVPLGTHYGWTGIGQGYFSMYYGPAHQHRMVNGALSRMPYSTLSYYSDSPLYSWLAGVRALAPEEQAAVEAELARYRDEYPIGYIFAYRAWMNAAQQVDWIGWLNMQPGWCAPQMADDGDLLWWRSAALGCDEPAPALNVDMGSASSWLVTGSGWYAPENIGGVSARWTGETALVRLAPLAARPSAVIAFRALPYGAGRTVTLRLGAWESAPLGLGEGWQEYTVEIPPQGVEGGWLILEHNGALSPAQAEGSGDTRALAAAYSNVRITGE